MNKPQQQSIPGHSDAKAPARRPTAAVAEYRRPLFAVGRQRVSDGAAPHTAGSESFGFVKVLKGGVTQHHRDLLDVIRTVAEYRVTDGGGQEHLIFDAAKVQAMMASEIDWRDIKKSLLEVAGTIVQIDGKGPGAWGAAFPLATFVGDANSDAARAPHQFPVRLKRLVLSAGLSSLLEKHATVTLSREVVTKVTALPNAVSRAVARWCLSHSNDQHHELGRILVAIGVVQPGEAIAGRASSRQTRHYVEQLRKDAAALAALGIAIDGLRLHYTRMPGAFISAPAMAVEAAPTGGGGKEAGEEKRKSVEVNPAVEGFLVEVNPAVVEVNPAVVEVNPAVSKEIPIRNLP